MAKDYIERNRVLDTLCEFCEHKCEGCGDKYALKCAQFYALATLEDDVVSITEKKRKANNDDIFKVYRYERDICDDTEHYDGWFYSKIYGVDDAEVLVYDDGFGSAHNDEEEATYGFTWVDPTIVYDDKCSGTRHYIMERVEGKDESI